MEMWEVVAREAIRDLVARYNANGDSGRFAQVLELFAPDAVMDIGDGREYAGTEEILSIFTGTRDRGAGDGGPVYVRHMVSTHQIDVADPASASGRAYFMVLTSAGLDHWGRYLDQYRVVDGAWRFTHRRVITDGFAPSSRFAPT